MRQAFLAGLATLVRGSSRRIKDCEVRRCDQPCRDQPSNISLINRRLSSHSARHSLVHRPTERKKTHQPSSADLNLRGRSISLTISRSAAARKRRPLQCVAGQLIAGWHPTASSQMSSSSSAACRGVGGNPDGSRHFVERFATSKFVPRRRGNQVATNGSSTRPVDSGLCADLLTVLGYDRGRMRTPSRSGGRSLRPWIRRPQIFRTPL